MPAKRAARKSKVLEAEIDDDQIGRAIKAEAETEQAPAVRVHSRPTLDDALLNKIALAIKASGVGGPAAIEGARLAQHWIEEVGVFDAQFPVIGAELPFFLLLEKYTVVLGVQDKLAFDANGIFGSEWKTTKGTTRYWNEEKWLDQIASSPQISIYGLAQHEGYFVGMPFDQKGTWIPGATMVTPDIGADPLTQLNVKNPRVLVRAITKENPPNLWGVDPPAFFEIDKKRLDITREALLLKADVIRAARNRKSVPWQLTGIQCQDRFHWGAFCRFHNECSRAVYPEGQPGGGHFNDDDPGSKALKAAQSLLRVALEDPRVVVISASAYSDATDCLEMYRRTAIAGSEEDPEMDKGTAFHAGVASYYSGLARK